MTDDLVQRLRDLAGPPAKHASRLSDAAREAADRIEAQQHDIDRLLDSVTKCEAHIDNADQHTAMLMKRIEALEGALRETASSEGQQPWDLRVIARRALEGK